MRPPCDSSCKENKSYPNSFLSLANFFKYTSKMKRKKRNILLSILIGAFLLLCNCRRHLLLLSVCSSISIHLKLYIFYVDRDDTADSIYHKIKEFGHVNKFAGFRWMAKYKDFDQNIHTGRYAIRPNDNVYHVYSRFSRGYQEAVNLTIGSVRTLDRLARSIGKQLMIDSAEIASQLFDSTFQAQMGYTTITLPSLFIPETYQVYWDMSVDDFFKRMKNEHERFWKQRTSGTSHRHRHDTGRSQHSCFHRRRRNQQQ